jgi:hypothetical protein
MIIARSDLLGIVTPLEGRWFGTGENYQPNLDVLNRSLIPDIALEQLLRPGTYKLLTPFHSYTEI